MTRQDNEAEIAKLRKKVEQLSSQKPVDPENIENGSEKKTAPKEDKAADGDVSELREKVEEFAELLEKELKNIPAAAAIAIFALGFVFGRIMTK
jgi:chromosome segregation ATPase